MKIAFFTDCYLDLTGGIVSSINAQKTELENRGHTVYLFSTGFPKSAKKLKKLSEKNIFQVPSCKIFFRKIAPVSRRPKIIERWLLKNYPEIKNFDIFYIHYESGCSIAGIRLAKKLNIPSVQVMHGREDAGENGIIPFGFHTIVASLLNWFHSWYLPHLTKVYRDNYLATSIAKAKIWTMMINHTNSADIVLVPSKHFREKLIHYGTKKEVKVFPNGFPNEFFLKTPATKKLKPKEDLRIIWHSRVSSEKRIIPFLEALSRIENYHLDIYGSGNEIYKAKLFAKKHHLNVKFHGNVKFKKLAEAINESHLDVLVSYNVDTFGMTLIEAEAFATPVFFCDPDMQEIVPQGSFVLSSGPNPAQMAKALNNILKHPEKIQRMSKVMLEHREEILISKRIEILEKIFNSVISKH